MTNKQKEALDAFLQVECKKGECDGPWCSTQTKIRGAFGYPTVEEEKLKKKEENLKNHEMALKELTSELNDLAKQKLSLDSLKQFARIADRLGEVSSCLYDKHFKLPPIVLKRGEDNYKERFEEVMKSDQDYEIISETGSAILSGGSSGSEFYTWGPYYLCGVCYPSIWKKEK